MFDSINVNELKKLHQINLIDLRCVTSYNNGHILDAINIPHQSLLVNPKKFLFFHKVYHLYCQSGITSRKVCSYLSKLGYKVVNVEGGYEEWVLEN